MARRYFLQLAGAAVAAWNLAPLAAAGAEMDPQLQEAVAKLEYLTPLDRAYILDKGKAGVGKLPPEKLREIGQVPAAGKPVEWPLRYTLAHWAVLLPGLPAGNYDLCCRTIDGNGTAQPLPRTLPRTGFNTRHIVNVVVKA